MDLLNQLKTTMDKVKYTVPKYLLTNPINGGELFGGLVGFNGEEYCTQPNELYNGIPIVYDNNIPARNIEEKWEFPEDRFVEYEESDELWARPLGFGKLKQIDMGPIVYMMEKDIQIKLDNFVMKSILDYDADPSYTFYIKPINFPVNHLMTSFVS